MSKEDLVRKNAQVSIAALDTPYVSSSRGDVATIKLVDLGEATESLPSFVNVDCEGVSSADVVAAIKASSDVLPRRAYGFFNFTFPAELAQWGITKASQFTQAFREARPTAVTAREPSFMQNIIVTMRALATNKSDDAEISVTIRCGKSEPRVVTGTVANIPKPRGRKTKKSKN